MGRVVIRRVRLKSGGEIELLRQPEAADGRADCERSVREVLDQLGDVAGYAFVAWEKDGGSCCTQCGTSNIPTPLVPDFVRNRLLLATAAKWSIEDMNASLGFSE